MTTFIKTKLKQLDDHTNIDKHRVTANITEYHIISKSIVRTDGRTDPKCRKTSFLKKYSLPIPTD